MTARGTSPSRLCRALIIGFAALWALAVAILVIGTFGLFGQERDPLSAVFLLPLGLPWALLPMGGAVWAILAPGINLALIVALCRIRRAR
ncbi:hypothetical protein ILP92_18145 [Maribius pontilimi]|uniref:Uncharacterized protein n=1 Tax=Palleronia pontilimi TaxID=1964209 RepID=A0A934IKK0_9RHOB|nr:hypothetical protein [Palleronia pontilimi]MBJ3764653.1 hypothetical protein [Palleronia pontilimi]